MSREDSSGSVPGRQGARRGRAGASSVHDVARLAGVSIATVSRTLNMPEKVSAPTRARIAEAARHLGYTPNIAARMLATQRSWTVAAIVPTVQNNIFARGIEAIGRRLERDGYTLLLGAMEYDAEREWRLTENFLARGVDGLIYMGASRLKQAEAALARHGIPYVNQGVFDPAGPHPCVGFDNAEIAGIAVRHLLELGHRRIGMVAGITRHNDRAAGRIAGLRRALAAAGLDPEAAPVIEQPYTIEGGREGLRAMLAQRKRPTALVCGNDILAFGVLFGARDRGIDIPRDLSVIGFDDLELCANLRPSLSSVHIPTDRMGELAAEYVLRRLAGETPPHATRIDVSLRARESTAPPGRG